jgi:hypothetical protein
VIQRWKQILRLESSDTRRGNNWQFWVPVTLQRAVHEARKSVNWLALSKVEAPDPLTSREGLSFVSVLVPQKKGRALTGAAAMVFKLRLETEGVVSL